MSYKNEEIEAINAEHDYASKRWGDEFDNKNTLNDWFTYATMYGADAMKMAIIGNTDRQYVLLIKAAGLFLRAAERVRTKTVAKRHYD